MDKTDVNQLPRPLFEALQRALESALDLHDTLVQVYPAQPTAPYPRSAMEVLCLDALRAIEPLPATPKQVAAMINKPNDEVYRILLALEILGTIYRPDQGVLQHRGTTAFQWDAVPTHRRGTAQHQYAARIARIVAQETRQAGEKSHPELRTHQTPTDEKGTTHD